LTIAEVSILVFVGWSLTSHYSNHVSNCFFHPQNQSFRFFLDAMVGLSIFLRLFDLSLLRERSTTRLNRIVLCLLLYVFGICFDLHFYFMWCYYAGMYGLKLIIYSLPILIFIFRILHSMNKRKLSHTENFLDSN